MKTSRIPVFVREGVDFIWRGWMRMYSIYLSPMEVLIQLSKPTPMAMRASLCDVDQSFLGFRVVPITP